MQAAAIFRVIALSGLAWVSVTGDARVHAEHCTFPPPQGPVLLEIAVEPLESRHRAPTRRIALDRHALESLPQDGFNTTTIWTAGEQAFQGVRLTTMLRCIGVAGGTLTLHASNAYLIDIPVATLREDGALIALRRNGAPMSTRDLGPLWLVFPYDGDPAFQTESTYAQSVWHLDHIRIGP